MSHGSFLRPVPIKNVSPEVIEEWRLRYIILEAKAQQLAKENTELKSRLEITTERANRLSTDIDALHTLLHV
jgi:hypothetical protein